MSERVCVRDLNDILGFAVRSDHDVEVVISSAVPYQSERESLANELSTAVRSAPGCYVTVVRHIRDKPAPTPRWRAKGLVMAIAAALIINLDLAG